MGLGVEGKIADTVVARVGVGGRKQNADSTGGRSQSKIGGKW